MYVYIHMYTQGENGRLSEKCSILLTHACGRMQETTTRMSSTRLPRLPSTTEETKQGGGGGGWGWNYCVSRKCLVLKISQQKQEGACGSCTAERFEISPKTCDLLLNRYKSVTLMESLSRGLSFSHVVASRQSGNPVEKHCS